MKYFWKQEFDLPKGIGYGRFSAAHILTLCVIAALIVLGTRLFLRCREQAQDTVVRLIPPVMAGLEVWKDLFLVSVHRFSIGYLPLHLCSLGIITFFGAAYAKSRKWREIWGEISFCLILPGAVSALIFPDWANLYPVFNFINLHSFTWHGLLVFFPVLLRAGGRVHPTVRHIHYSLLFLAAVVPPILIFDKMTGCNYLFVNRPVSGTPLEALADLMGNPGYLIGYAAMVVGVILLVYGLIYLADCVGKRLRADKDI
ncbi:MAG: YwaF family protein [Lachnospiraceae bacterium]|jgi:hypothetical integral membrane protein (TIGR02206 family)|nr:YwaF family protein [Lachnospiraceae bacterium]MCH4064313.1 YwaF family protein [Lachnospiraceae bacterium]MCH4102962.1 YwaF family protein [Lachnospiraceae bacterium]MCI1308951.1 YwaF family protein [Lachnospiraceae bacterium]MCI1333419.1 YwaF family protein [Lachnospiraceae bacterium]